MTALFVILFVLVGVLAVCIALQARRVRDVERDVERVVVTALSRNTAAAPEVAPDPNELLAGPPMVNGAPLQNWLAHYTHGDYAWPDVVKVFYDRAADDPEVAAYFYKADLTELQRHFARAMVMVTKQGVTRKTVNDLKEAHANVTTASGKPITDKVYKKVIDTLAGVLTDAGVPQDAIGQLAQTVAPLRAAIVAG